MSTNPQEGSRPSVVLVHGAWVDGSGWQGMCGARKPNFCTSATSTPAPRPPWRRSEPSGLFQFVPLNLTPLGTQYGATLGKAQQRNPSR